MKKKYEPVEPIYETQSFCMLSEDQSRVFFSIKLDASLLESIRSQVLPLKLSCALRANYPEVVRVKLVEDRSNDSN